MSHNSSRFIIGQMITHVPSIKTFLHLQYLGDDLEEVRGRTVLEDDSYLELPLLSLPGVVLVPGQTLPLQLFQPSTVSMKRNLLDKDKTFGMVTARYSGIWLCNIITQEGSRKHQREKRRKNKNININIHIDNFCAFLGICLMM